MKKAVRKIKMLKTGDIIPNPYQVRRIFDQKELEILAESLKEVGMLNPLIVRRNHCGYELICGQRRLRAAFIAKMEEVPAIIVRAGDLQCAQLSLIENIHRKNIGIFEEAEAFYNLMMYHSVKKDKLQKNIAVNSLKISESVRLLGLNEDIRTKIEGSKLDERYIKQILRIHNDAERIILTNKIINEKLSVCEAEEYADNFLKNRISNTEKTIKNPIKNKTPLFDNTVRKTVELLKKYGAKVEFSRISNEECTEYYIKTMK